ncbi:MAG: alpha-amylase family glycosyl hydrolase, partial [Bacteroidota bacterium]
GGNSDSVTITVQAGAVQITNLGNFVTRNPVRMLYGTVEDTSIHNVRVVRNSTDTLSATASGGAYSLSVNLVEGLNTFRGLIKDSTGTTQLSSPVNFTYFVNHAPNAQVSYLDIGSSVRFSAGLSTDPDLGQTATLQFEWAADSTNPAALAGFPATGVQVDVLKPTTPGEYFVRLIATDDNGNKDTVRSFFTILNDGSFQPSTLASVPRWVKQGRVYSIFFKGLTQEGTINAAVPYLSYFKRMGFNIIWVLPVMKNAYPIDNGGGPGYNISDFYKVAPEYGTNDDFKHFVSEAHKLGLKVILDVTPNHTSYQHPFVLEARQYRENSPHWSFYVHSNTNHPSNGLGVSLTADGFQYYSGFSDQLLNYNWADIDARAYMIGVYTWWVRQFDIDGYRFDVYWGPHNRSNNFLGGETEMGIPVRQALKHIKPDIYILGETSGTGGGTDVNYADKGGGMDGGYDWNLYGGGVAGLFPSYSAGGFTNFVNGVNNGGFFPGPNSSYLRFLENHDEERIVYRYQQYYTTKPPGSVIFTAPGMPMLWQGQELGIGLLVPQGQDRRRAVIDWNGNVYGKSYLQGHYQHLAQIRSQFPAFSTQQMKTLSSTSPLYAYIRPYAGEDGIVAVNFSDAVSVQTSLQIQSADLGAPILNKSYKLSDLYNDSSSTVTFVNGSFTLNLSLAPLSSVVFVLADSVKHLDLPTLTSVEGPTSDISHPKSFALSQNYPNPFNPATTIRFQLPAAAFVSLKVYDMLGREVSTLVNGERPAGDYSVQWNGSGFSSGIYVMRMYVQQAGGAQTSFVASKKIILLK